MPVQLPGNPDHDWDRQAKFDVLSIAIPDPGTFPVLAVRASIRMAFSTAPVLVSVAAGIGTATVTHGLGTIPLNIMLTAFNVGAGGIAVEYDSVGATTFRIVVYAAGAYNQPVSWTALG